MNKPSLLWLDLEMTDLDPVNGQIVEIATTITDRNIRIVAQGPDIVIHQTQKTILNLNSWCKEHFEKSGLIEEMSKSTTTLKQAEDSTINFIESFFPLGQAMLAGNSVYIDREFISIHMPKLFSFLHYRVIDVNSIKELAYRWYPDLPIYEKEEVHHRSRYDIIDSMEELKYYQKQIFKKSK